MGRLVCCAAALAAVTSFAGACGIARPPAVDGRVANASHASETAAAPEPDPEPHLVIRLRERRLYLMDGAPDPEASFPIAIGREGFETPLGQFHVEEMVENPDFEKVASGVVVERIPPGPANPLGARWIGFVRGPGWTIGIHGTPKPDLLGQAVSSGCVRMRNADVIGIYDRVRIGTPVRVEP